MKASRQHDNISLELRKRLKRSMQSLQSVSELLETADVEHIEGEKLLMLTMELQEKMRSACDALSRPRPKKPRIGLIGPGWRRDCGVDEANGHRYRTIRSAVAAGQLKPSVRAIQAAAGGGTEIVRAYLQEMVREGVIVRQTKGYALALIGGAA